MSFGHAGISKADAAAYSSDDDDESDNDGLARPTVDPRDDEFGDYNPRKRRRTGRNAKESAALGVFGSDSDEDTPNRRWKSKQNLRHKNVAFVSAGAERLSQRADEEDQGDHDHDEGQEELSENKDGGQMAAEESEDEGEDGDEEMAGAGLGFRSSTQASGLGWGQPAPNMFGNTPSKRSNIMKTTYDGSNPLGKSFVPTSAKEPVLNPNVVDHEPSPTSQTPIPSAFGGGSKSKSKSFAARMMAKMGYVEGQGLGANAQGRASIIEPTLRPQGNVGLGTVREKSQQELKEEKRQARLRGEDVLDSDEERKAKRERKKRTGAGESGSGSGVSTPRRSKTKYMTVGDVRKAAPGLHIPEAFAPILDMTRPDQRLLTSRSGLLTPTAGAAGTSSTEVVEQTEARKAARQVQGTLAACVEEWKALEERKAWLDMEVLQRQQEVEERESEFSLLQAFSLLLGDISQATRDQQWDPVISGLQKVEAEALGPGSDHNEVLASIAVAVIHPFLATAIQGWQPLEDPNLGNFVTDISKIRKLVGIQPGAAKRGIIAKWTHNEVDDSSCLHVRSTTPYESMIYKLVFPKLVTTISQTWNVHDATPLLTVLEKWEPLFPAFVRSQLLEQVARKLEGAISSWRPKNERSTPPHLWIFPWLQYLPPYHLEPKGTGVVSEIRRKFRQTIDSWQFDKGVVPGLKNWQDVLRPSRAHDQWKPLVMHHILPSMGRYIRTNFRVNPGDQEPYLKMLQGIMKWTDIISSSLVGEVVVQEVFPMWHDVLHQWLTSDEVNYEEVGAWFEWWQNDVLPPAIASLDNIKAELQRGAVMIEKALELGDTAKHLLPRAGTGRTARKSRPSRPNREQQKKSEPTVPAPAPEPVEPTFREEIEAWCLENDLQFIPVHKTNELGHHYFRLTARLDGKGGVLAYFSGENVLAIESRKTNGEFRRANKADWDALFAVLFEDAEGK
ncbi:hypothetical protein RRF57_011637 [Xylaria bambusicola]|uniref:G-patch domain-containing protein n=1 Tax=Xylaria bambusicola TaxID=326684 RepID=A0AAN7UN58_9PEZI